jgi:hypothetical protein
MGTDNLEIIFLDTGAVIATGIAAPAGTDFVRGAVKHKNFVSFRLGAFYKLFNEVI